MAKMEKGKTQKKAAATNPSVGGAMDYQAQDDLHTLTRAHEIKSDKGRHAKAKALAKQKLDAMQDIKEGTDPNADNDSDDKPTNKKTIKNVEKNGADSSKSHFPQGGSLSSRADVGSNKNKNVVSTKSDTKPQKKQGKGKLSGGESGRSGFPQGKYTKNG